MKRNLFAVTILALLVFISCTESASTNINRHWQAYKQAMNFGDIKTAIVEVNQVLTYDTTNQAALDTLSRLYFIDGNNYGAFKTSLAIKEKTLVQKNILAEAAFNIGKTEVAKENYTIVIEEDTTNNIAAKYRLATLNFSDKNYQEALALLGDVVGDEASLEQVTRVRNDNNTYQNVSLYSASHNFAGYVFLVNGDFETADGHFKEALRVQPNFILAQNNTKLVEEERNKTE